MAARNRRYTYDLSGHTFGNVTVLRRDEPRAYKCVRGESRYQTYRCRCSCGREFTVGYTAIMAHSPNWVCFECKARKAALKKNNDRACKFWYKHRHDRIVHPDWANSIDAFIEYIGQPPNTEGAGNRMLIHLLDKALGFVPGNVAWVPLHVAWNDGSRKGQVLITVGGVTKSMSDWAVSEGVSRQAIEIRIKRGSWRNMPIERVK